MMTEPSFPPGSRSPPAARTSSRRLRISLGTWVAIEATADSASAEQEAIDAAYAAISEVDRRMHPRRAGSDLARINCAQLQTPLEIQPSTWKLLKLAKRLHVLTDGVFDPCLPGQPGGLGDVEIGPEPVVTCHAPVALDFGGIAKGYAIDCAVDVLTALGCSAGLVNAGGDLRVFGTRREAILLRRADDSYQRLELGAEALAVSDLDATERPSEHQGYYNRTGDSAAVRRYAAVVAKDAATADALTKCVLLCPGDLTASVLRDLGARSLVT
jgi:thiamine biosynthesis lipoprotein